MPRWVPSLAIACPSIAVMVLGSAALVGWLAPTPQPWLVPREGSVTLVASTAVALIVAGFGTFAAYRPFRMGPRAHEAAGAFLLLLAAIVLFEHGTGISLGVDLPRLHRGLEKVAAHPGRMPLPTAVALVVTGLLLVGMRRVSNRLGAFAAQALLGLLLAIGAVSLIAADVASEGLLPWYRYSRMAQPTAFAFLGIGIAMMALVARSRWYETVYAHREDEKILIVALGILAFVAVTTSAAGFVMMQKNLEEAVRNTLEQAIADRGAIIENLVNNRVQRASIISGRPTVQELLAGPASADRTARLAREGASYLAFGFRGVAFDDADGRRLASAGYLLEAPQMEVPLKGLRSQVTFAWDEAFVLRARVPVMSGAARVGTVVSEQALEILPRLQMEVGALGDTAEWVLCAAQDADMACFPQRFAPYPRVAPRLLEGVALPMDHALRGETGVMNANDYRGVRVIAGYAPVGGTGLGVVLKLGTDEVYAPLREQLGLWWRWFWGLAIIGALLLASQMQPIARRLVVSENLARDRAHALARSERALRELYLSLGDGIVVLRADGAIEFMNPAAEKLFGFEPGQGIGRNVSELVPESLRDANAASTRRFLAAGTSNVVGRRDLVYPALRSDGTRFDAEFSLEEMGQGSDRRLVAVVRDVSERTALARMKSEFIAGVSHELRTPLTSIIGSLEMMREGDPLPEPHASLLEMAARNSARLSALVDDVIDAERIDSGALRFADEEVNVQALLRDAVQMNQSYAAGRGVRLEVEEPLPAAIVRGDRGRLLQVMANLLSNAAKFSPPQATVEVRARTHHGSVRIEVADHGAGIPDEFRARVFEKFAQAESSDSGRRAGTGLGLAISKAIVERLGGVIGFDSRRGEGSTFFFELPVAS